MPHEPLILQAKLAPPRPHRRLLPRPALTRRLREALDYRLTVVQAGTGYGKTTALTALADGSAGLCWYSLGEGDADPQVFLSYLVAACAAGLPGLSEQPAARLREGDASPATLDALLNALAPAMSGPTLLVLDDYQFVSGSPEIKALTERLISYAPPDLHLLLASRYPLPGSELVRWRVRGEVLELGRETLAFAPAEIAALFRDIYGLALDPADVAALAHQTEGWPIVLHLVWQGLQSGAARSVTELLASGPASLVALFEYLASDVLDRQPRTLAAFLRDTAALRELNPVVCDAVRGAKNSAALIDQLRERDLFVVELGERHLRYHHLFHDFLRQQAAATGELAAQHRRAAAHFSAAGDDAAIYHWLAAGESAAAAEAIERAGEEALRSGRLDTLAGWIDALPPGVLGERPRLQAYLGDLYRLRSRFDEARSWYAQAEDAARLRGDRAGQSRALRGQALVFLDQVQPAQAESLLQAALHLSDGLDDRQAHARLLELLAENKLNMGKPAEAEALRAEAQALRSEGPAEDLLSVRVKLRTGRLAEARATLEQWAAAEARAADRGEPASPRSHRETVLILALIYLFQGELEQAFALAGQGVTVGERHDAPFITSVAHARLGHAWQLRAANQPDPAAARASALRCYDQALAEGDSIAAPRLKGEPLWGLTRLHGLHGDLAAAERAAAQGMQVCRWAGDPWVAAMIELTLGLSYVHAGRPAQAAELLGRVLVSFRECGDSLGRAATRLWLALAHADLRQRELAQANLQACLALVAAHGYDHLLTRPGLLSPPDPRRLVPLLIEARAGGAYADQAGRLLGVLGLAHASVHPGYQLRARTLGTFRAWRGEQEIEARAWQRDKARQLFQLLLARRGRWMQRDEICDLLWPQLSPDAAARDFKVALNALNKALEPARASDALAAFVVRDGSAYRLRPEADIWHDAAAFAAACAEGAARLDAGDALGGAERLAAALQLYAGDYLPDAIYDDWAAVERERLRDMFLRAAEQLAATMIDLGQPAQAAEICGRIIAHERCHERAYRLLMLAHAQLGNRPLALRAYQRCVEALRSELAVEPAPATADLHERIRRGEPHLPPVTVL